MACKGVCDKLQCALPRHGGRYWNGQRRCQVCEIFIMTKELRCPCCNTILRRSPRSLACKIKYRGLLKEDLKNV